jgi:hypothetical protein
MVAANINGGQSFLLSGILARRWLHRNLGIVFVLFCLSY